MVNPHCIARIQKLSIARTPAPKNQLYKISTSNNITTNDLHGNCFFLHRSGRRDNEQKCLQVITSQYYYTAKVCRCSACFAALARTYYETLNVHVGGMHGGAAVLSVAVSALLSCTTEEPFELRGFICKDITWMEVVRRLSPDCLDR